MSEERAKAKERIAKLLALANRPGTEAEGEAALARANALATKHGFVIRKAVKQPTRTTGGQSVWQDFLRQEANRQRQQRPQARPRSSRSQTEARRKRTTYSRAYQRGHRAFQDGRSSRENPYHKHVWGVDLPGAWRRGWIDAHSGVRDYTTPYDQEANL